MKTLIWEQIKQDGGGSMARSMTPTGWLVCQTEEVFQEGGNGIGLSNGWSWTSSITFVPDLEHVWLQEDGKP